jgi:hypothetical protein
VIHVYAILRSTGGPDAPATGLGDRPIEIRPAGPFAAAFSRHGQANVAVTPDNLWAHERVVERLMANHTVLPARFGTALADVPELDAALLRHGPRLATALDHVEGCVELGLRALWRHPEDALANDTDAPPPSTPIHAAGTVPGTGRAYMEARLAQEQRSRSVAQEAEALADALHAPLAALAKDSVRRTRASEDLVLSAAYLVPADTVDAFRSQVLQARSAHGTVRVLCTGPWPPYHFTPVLDLAEVLRAG